MNQQEVIYMEEEDQQTSKPHQILNIQQKQQSENSFDNIDNYHFDKAQSFRRSNRLLAKTNRPSDTLKTTKRLSSDKQIDDNSQTTKNKIRTQTQSQSQTQTQSQTQNINRNKKLNKKQSVAQQVFAEAQAKSIFQSLVDGMDPLNPDSITPTTLLKCLTLHHIQGIQPQMLNEMINLFRVQNGQEQKETLSWSQFKDLYKFVKQTKQ